MGVTPGVIGIEVAVVIIPLDTTVVVDLGLHLRNALLHAAGAAGLAQIFLGLRVGLIDGVSSSVGGIAPIQPVAVRIVEHVVDIGGDDRGGFDAPADHIERRMHAGEDAVVADISGARQQALVLLGYQEGEAQRLIIG